MSVNLMNTTNGVVAREVLLGQGNYTEFRDFLKTKMEDDKIEDEAVEICFRVVKTVEMVEFTTPARKKTVLEAEEARQLAAIEENFVKINKTRVDIHEAMPDGTPTQMLEKNKVESKLAEDRKTHSELVKKGFTAIGNLLRRYIAPEMQATLNAGTNGLWNEKCCIATWEKMAGYTLAWIFSCYFATGAEGKPHLEYKLRSMIMMTASMKASDPFEISIQLEKIRKMELELEAENLTAGKIIETICKHPVVYQFKHECLRVMQDEAKEKVMQSDELLARAANKLATQMAEEKAEQGKVDLTVSSITQTVLQKQSGQQLEAELIYRRQDGTSWA